MWSLFTSPLLFRLSLLSGLLLLMTLPARAALPEYSVGVEDVDYYPIYSVTAPDYQYRGYARDLLDLFATREHIQLRYVALPVRRLFHNYWAGRLDLVFPDSPRWNVTQKQPHKVIYSQPVLVFQDAMLVLPSRLGEPLEHFRKLGFVRGFTPWKFQEQIAAGQVKIEESPGPEGLIRMALAGYIDGANMAQQVARYHLTLMGKPQGLVVEPSLLTLQDSHYYLSSIRHPELIARFDAFLRREARAVKALKVKYGLD
ncbi:MAG: transporter substrate-binding domain-containing protein [Pseudomonas sp.]|uniref:substrate-binding periplasmic protein n=1 Tax=Pseudomonas sp. TaxID=306 RepID=UPI00339970CA